MRRRERYWSLYHQNESNLLNHLRTDQVEVVFSALPKNHKPEWFVWKEGSKAWRPLEDFPQILLELRQSSEIEVVPEPPPLPFSASELVRSSALYQESENKPSTGHKPKATDKTVPSAKKLTPVPVQIPVKVAAAKTDVSNVNNSANDTGVTNVVQNIGKTNAIDFSLMQGKPDERQHGRYKRRFELAIHAKGTIYRNSTVDISVQGMLLKDPLPRKLPPYFNVELRAGEMVVPLVCSVIPGDDGQAPTRLKIEVNDHFDSLLTMLLAG